MLLRTRFLAARAALVLPLLAGGALLFGAAPQAGGDRDLAYLCLQSGSHASPAATIAVSVHGGGSTMYGVCLRRNAKGTVGTVETYWRSDHNKWKLLGQSSDPKADGKLRDATKFGVPAALVPTLREHVAIERARSPFPV